MTKRQHRTARMSVAEAVLHIAGSATQLLFDIGEEAGRSDINDPEVREQIHGRLESFKGRVREAIDLLQASGKVLERQPASRLKEVTPVEVANALHGKERM